MGKAKISIDNKKVPYLTLRLTPLAGCIFAKQRYLMAYIFINGHPVLQTSAKSKFIGIFQLTAKCYTTGNGRNS